MTIGNDTISSIRLNYTCFGPVRQTPAISHIKVLNNSTNIVDCGSTYSRRTKDLNDNAGGNWIYLCIQYAPFRPTAQFMYDLTTESQIFPGAPSGCIDSDLNKGTGGSYVYFCPHYDTLFPPNLPLGPFAIRDIDFYSYDTLLQSLAADTLADCRFKMGDSSNTTVVWQNLNSDAGGDYIYTCLLGYGSPLDSFDPYLFLSTTLTAVQDPANPLGTPVNYRGSAYDYWGASLVVDCSWPAAFTFLGGWTTWAPLGATTVDCWASDSDGRTASGSFEIQVVAPPDTTAPVITASATAGGGAYTPGTWTNQTVTVTFSCVDEVSGSGVESVTDPLNVATEGTNQSAEGTCEDVAGNASSTTFSGINIDKTAPAIAFEIRTPANGAGWNNGDVTVIWTCQDGLSGPVSGLASQTVTAEVASQSATGMCEDPAGNTASDTQTGINIDKTDPNPDHSGPYTVGEGETIQLDGSNSSDSLSGVADIAWSTGGDEVFEDGNPASFSRPDGPAVYTVKMLVEDLAGNAATAETTVTVNNLPPVIQVITTNAPVPQGQPATITVAASDPGINDVLSYAFDCDNDGLYETPGNGNRGSCTLDPAVAYSAIGVEVRDDDQGVTTGSVTISQTVTLCANSMSGALSATGRDGNCPSGSTRLVLPTASPVRLCISSYTGAILWGRNGSCASGYRAYLVPASGPLYYCASDRTGKLRGVSNPGQCIAGERAGVIPG